RIGHVVRRLTLWAEAVRITKCVEHIRHEIIGRLCIIDVVSRTGNRLQTLHVATVRVIDRHKDSAVVLEFLGGCENVDSIELIKRLADEENGASRVVSRICGNERRCSFHSISHLGCVSGEVRNVKIEDVVDRSNIAKVAHNLNTIGVSNHGDVSLEHLSAVSKTEEQRL
ncbi:hypothetical protein PFISCL1PPCAC_11503, partial [Pristionchus fissidentatus]